MFIIIIDAHYHVKVESRQKKDEEIIKQLSIVHLIDDDTWLNLQKYIYERFYSDAINTLLQYSPSSQSYCAYD